jgi:putative flippase GtrA
MLSVTSPRAPDLFLGRDVYQQGSRRLTDHLSGELLRYIVVGGLASIVDVGLLVGLTTFGGVYYLHAATIALGCGLLTSYLLSIAWVFQERTWRNPVVEFGLFTLISGVGLMGNGACMWILTEYAHLHYLGSKLVAALCVFLWNFLAKKCVLFH